MKHLKRAILMVFAGGAAMLGIWADAANVFVPVVTSSSPSGTVAHAPREQLVLVARHELTSVRSKVTSTGAGRLLLNVGAELNLGVAVERTAPTRWGYSLSGRIDHPTVGFVTLVVHDEAVAGAIWTPDASYEVVHLGGGIHAVREVVDNVHSCGGAVTGSEARPFVWSESAAAGDEITVVDVLVVWTPQREEEAGTAEAVRAEIDLGIAYTNDAFERSGAFVSLNLVGAERIEYDEPNISGIVLDRLYDSSDGHMDAVHDRRDALGADLVSLAIADCGGCGAAVLGRGFMVSSRKPSTVAHEFGHNFGLKHERFEWTSSLYNHGYAAFKDSLCMSTIMAYGEVCGRRLPRGNTPLFSSPGLFHPVNGARLGVSRFRDTRGADGPADAVLYLNRVRNSVANFRPRHAQRLD